MEHSDLSSAPKRPGASAKVAKILRNIGLLYEGPRGPILKKHTRIWRDEEHIEEPGNLLWNLSEPSPRLNVVTYSGNPCAPCDHEVGAPVSPNHHHHHHSGNPLLEADSRIGLWRTCGPGSLLRVPPSFICDYVGYSVMYVDHWIRFVSVLDHRNQGLFLVFDHWMNLLSLSVTTIRLLSESGAIKWNAINYYILRFFLFAYHWHGRWHASIRSCMFSVQCVDFWLISQQPWILCPL